MKLIFTAMIALQILILNPSTTQAQDSDLVSSYQIASTTGGGVWKCVRQAGSWICSFFGDNVVRELLPNERPVGTDDNCSECHAEAYAYASGHETLTFREAYCEIMDDVLCMSCPDLPNAPRCRAQ